jgi:hypothetical protein
VITLDWNAIGGVAGALSTLLAIYTIYSQKRNAKPRIRVETGYGFTTAGPYVDSDSLFITQVTNHGNVPVILNNIRYAVVGPQRNPAASELGNPNPEGSVSLPHLLAPGEKVSLWVEAPYLAKRFKYGAGYSGTLNLKVRVTDKLDRTFESKVIPFDLEGFAK